MSCEAPARLTSELLVKKGNAAPASYGLPMEPVSSLVQSTQKVGRLFSMFQRREEAPARPVETPRPTACRQPRPPDAPARVALRLDDDRQLRLERACADRELSRQQLLTQALDAYLHAIAPSICGGRCACLARSDPS